jgi:hypothetical protein
MNDWLAQAREEIAATVGDRGAAYELSREDVAQLLELARVAAHESGDRTNAPLTTYLVGLARGRHPEQPLSDLVRALSEESAGP